MKLILRIPYSDTDGYTYSCFWTKIVPIEHSDKDAAHVELLDLIAANNKKFGDRKAAEDKLLRSCPAEPPAPQTQNKKELQKHKRLLVEYDRQEKEWSEAYENLPPHASDYIAFCGLEIAIAQIEAENILIETLEEWLVNEVERFKKGD